MSRIIELETRFKLLLVDTFSANCRSQKAS